jgi:hypothetical protein
VTNIPSSLFNSPSHFEWGEEEDEKARQTINIDGKLPNL